MSTFTYRSPLVKLNMCVLKLLTPITHCANIVLTEVTMRSAFILVLFTLPLIMAIVSVRDAERRYKRIIDKIERVR